MESIGTLAGVIAHEFNNILSIILGNNELAMEDAPDWNPVRENLEQIRIAGIRASGVVRQLLAFCRKADSGRQWQKSPAGKTFSRPGFWFSLNILI